MPPKATGGPSSDSKRAPGSSSKPAPRSDAKPKRASSPPSRRGARDRNRDEEESVEPHIVLPEEMTPEDRAFLYGPPQIKQPKPLGPHVPPETVPLTAAAAGALAAARDAAAAKPPEAKADKDKDGKDKKEPLSKEEQAKLALQQETSAVDQQYKDQRELERVEAMEKENALLRDLMNQQMATLKRERATHEKHGREAKRILLEEKEVNKNLTTKLSDLSTRLDTFISDSKKQVESMVEKHVADRKTLTDQLAEKQAALDKLKEFSAQKDALERKLVSLTEALKDSEKQHLEEVGELKRRHLIEKSKLRHEMLAKIRETKYSLLTLTEDQLHTTTKRTIVENEQMTTELQYQSKETERALRRNDELAAENKLLRRQLELHEDAKTMLATRTHFFQKLIGKLNQKLKEKDALLAGGSGGAGAGGDEKGGADPSATASSSLLTGGGISSFQSTKRGIPMGPASVPRRSGITVGTVASLEGRNARRSQFAPGALPDALNRSRDPDAAVRVLALQNRLRETEDALRAAQAEAEIARDRLDAAQAGGEGFAVAKDEANNFLLACLDDLKRELNLAPAGSAGGRAGGADGDEAGQGAEDTASLSSLSPSDRAMVLEALLQRLNARPITPRAGAASVFTAQQAAAQHSAQVSLQRPGSRGSGTGGGASPRVSGLEASMARADAALAAASAQEQQQQQQQQSQKAGSRRSTGGGSGGGGGVSLPQMRVSVDAAGTASSGGAAAMHFSRSPMGFQARTPGGLSPLPPAGAQAAAAGGGGFEI